MDCKDLMVGDWVNYWILNLNAKVFSILGNHTIGIQFVDKNNKVEAMHGLIEKVIRPIPLTSDILVKNGFEKQGDLYQYHINAGNGYTRIDIIDLQDGVWSYDIDVYDKFADAHKIHHDDDCFLKLHQLQHLLRLCGIEKEITI